MMYIRGYYTDEPEYKERRVEKKTEKELVSMNWLEYQQLVKQRLEQQTLSNTSKP